MQQCFNHQTVQQLTTFKFKTNFVIGFVFDSYLNIQNTWIWGRCISYNSKREFTKIHCGRWRFWTSSWGSYSRNYWKNPRNVIDWSDIERLWYRLSHLSITRLSGMVIIDHKRNLVKLRSTVWRFSSTIKTGSLLHFVTVYKSLIHHSTP